MEKSREARIHEAIREDAEGLVASLLAGITGQQMVDLIWTFHDPTEAHQPDPCYIAAVVARAVYTLIQADKIEPVAQFEFVMKDELVHNPGFVI